MRFKEKTMSISHYYKKIVEHILEINHNDFSNVAPGHCMKLVGLGMEETEYFWKEFTTKFTNVPTYIISNNENIDDKKYITATKLIEYRNQDKPIFILIPSNSKTAAEDSYGNATFKEISLDNIENGLFEKLISHIPADYQRDISELMEYLRAENIPLSKKIDYILELDTIGYSVENIGNAVHFLSLIPDSKLLMDRNNVRNRLNFNLLSVNTLSSFIKPLINRINDLPIKKDTIQKDIVETLRNVTDLNSKADIIKVLKDNAKLNFCYWDIPQLNNNKPPKVFVEHIRSTAIKIEEGRKVLKATEGNSSKVTIRITTEPDLKDIKNLKYFKVFLMAVDSEAGKEINLLRKVKNTDTGKKGYKEIQVDIGPNLEEGGYFFKALITNEDDMILNIDDDFKSDEINEEWELEKARNPNAVKSSLKYKLTCDSEDFTLLINETTEEQDGEQRKDKINSVLQAYFKFRTTLFKTSKETCNPTPEENSNVWISDKTKKLISTYYIRYSEKNNYQISIPTKLRQIEYEFLNKNNKFGYVQANLDSINSFDHSNIAFIESNLMELFPESLIKLRKEVFTSIKESNETKDGIFESAPLFLMVDSIKNYLHEYTTWMGELKNKIQNENLSREEFAILSEVQYLDLVKLYTKLPDGSAFESYLISPLHPLRLSWFIKLYELFSTWEKETFNFKGHIKDWTERLENYFENLLYPQNNPLVIVDSSENKSFLYSGEITYGWGVYLKPEAKTNTEQSTSSNRQMKQYLRSLLNIEKNNFIDNDINIKVVMKYIEDYRKQHPYTEKLIINLVNAGDATVFSEALIKLEKDKAFQNIKYEIRLFKGDDRIIEHGQALKNLINPEYNVSEEAEIFSQASENRLFPKLRFSINTLSDYIKESEKYKAHISFLINPFPLAIELIKPDLLQKSFYLNGIVTVPVVSMESLPNEYKWNRYIVNPINNREIEVSNNAESLFQYYQAFISFSLASRYSDSIPAIVATLSETDKVLLNNFHQHSDWVVTLEKNIGPQLYDQPSQKGNIPFLLDYIPNTELNGISSYLTTQPEAEVYGLLSPHFEEFGIDIETKIGKERIELILEDLRSVSSSLILSLNNSKNKAFEIIGIAFTKKILEKKDFLEEAFLVPIDLHQDLFANAVDSSTRADLLLVKINPEKKEILFHVLEVKCRAKIGVAELDELKIKIKAQIDNTIKVIKEHFDPTLRLTNDRLDRKIKNLELKHLLQFYIERAYRYKYLSENAFNSYSNFLLEMDNGFDFKFKKLGFIFDFGTDKKHSKKEIEKDFTLFTFGRKLIEEILDPESDLNTQRLENADLDNDFKQAIGNSKTLRKLILTLKGNALEVSYDDDNIEQTTEEVDNNESLEVNTISKPLIESSNDELPQPQQKNEQEEVDEKVGLPPNTDYPLRPTYDILIGKTSGSDQYGILGRTIYGKKIAIDLSETNTISLFGVQGGGKSYTIGTITEMVLKQITNINIMQHPLAGVIFHYSESSDYKPEFTSMSYINDNENEIKKLKELYNADPDKLNDIVILTPKDKVQERSREFPHAKVYPIAFNSQELNVQDWLFLLGAIGNDSTYIKQLKAIMKANRNQLSLANIRQGVENSELLSNSQRALALQRLNFAEDYIDDNFGIKDYLHPERLIIVDLRDEFITKDEALGIFVIMLNIFSSVTEIDGKGFNKFIVFDEAHKYMDSKDLTGSIVTAIREMRHKGVSIMIASQDPPSLPNEIIELSSVVLIHKFNSPQWLKHIQKSITQLNSITPDDMAGLLPGEGFLWATKATDSSVTNRPIKIVTRPRVTKHGGETKKADG
jgi:DNA phosphorothioation-dependent restriction protein DptH